MKPDMLRKAITARLRRVSQLRRLCLSLGKAKRKGSSSAGSQDRQSVQSS